MTPAQRIRKAALGSKPTQATWLISAWVDSDLFPYVKRWAMVKTGAKRSHWYDTFDDDPNVRRMFLLFVAEALENE